LAIVFNSLLSPTSVPVPRLKILIVLTPHAGLHKALIALVAMAGEFAYTHTPVLRFIVEQPLSAMPLGEDATIAVVHLI